MAQLWGGRFTKETSQDVFDFNESLSFDRRLIIQDIRGSIAHVRMLGKQGIIQESEAALIEEGLGSILKDYQEGRVSFEGGFEDIHSFVEANLIDRIGDVGKKLHTGRSRNDQVALDMRLYTRDHLDQTADRLKDLLGLLTELMREHLQTVMPGFTHLQKAQPVTLAHHLGAYFEMFRRDRERMKSIRERMNLSPLGSGALAGTTYPLDREYTAGLLGFDGIMTNSMDAVSDRDYLIEYLDALAIVMMHMSRLCEELITWNSDEYKFIEMDDAYSTGSSIMPQKKNPDVAELIRGKCGRVYGALMGLLATMKSLPLAYNKDMQEDKEGAFMAMDTVAVCLPLLTGMLATVRFNKDRMRESANRGFTNATDVADYLVRKGVFFRDAHRIVGELVLYCIDQKKGLDELTIGEFRQFTDAAEDDIYEAIALDTCVRERTTDGAPGPEAMEAAIRSYELYLKEGM
ncbi:MAG: argininosuccinate lyase [Lachnospiraceae bacterium]|nr:argininosuccinate lyase [Lachnospiraceae bacterium]